MKTRWIRHNGFSLTEVLIATGILALGLVMIAMAFPVGVKLASIATERPVGVVAANEAFAKLCLYSRDPDGAGNVAVDYMATEPSIIPINTCWDLPTLQAQEKLYFIPPQIPSIWAMPNDERVYPSLVPMPEEKRYYWSALVRRVDSNTNQIQATVFVCRMLGMGSTYYTATGAATGKWPVPVKVQVLIPVLTTPKEIQVVIPSPLIYPPSGTEYRFFTEGCKIVEDSTGSIYKVMEMKDNSSPLDGIRETLVLDKAFTGTALPYYVWVVPPAIGSSRNPCIDVTQKPLAF